MEFRDLKAQYAALKKRIDSEMAEVVAGAEFISGKKVRQLEEALAEYVGVRRCVSCASGTDALIMPLMYLGVGPGDAVFVPDFTFFATAEAVARLGATPVFVDVEPSTFNLDPESLARAVGRVEKSGRLRPRAVIPVDLFGRPADYARIGAVAKAHGLFVLEDAAQGFGGAVGKRRAGSFGDAAATSFFPAKPLGCYGDGGAVFTDDDKLADFVRSVAVHGKGEDKYDNVRVGLNSRLDTLQAAVLLAKLEAFPGELGRVNAAAAEYGRLLAGRVGTSNVGEGFESSWAQYSVLLPDGESRARVQSALAAAGIPSNIYYKKPLHSQKAFAALAADPDEDGLRVTSDICSRVLSLPMHPYLSEDDIRLVSGTVLAAL